MPKSKRPARTEATSAANADIMQMSEVISYRVSILHSLMNKATTHFYSERGLNSHQWKVLSVLYRMPPMPAARITEVVTLDKAAISRAIRSLSNLGLVERRFDEARQAITVALTDAGRKQFRGIAQDYETLQKRLFAGVGRSQRRCFFHTLDQVEDALRDICELQAPRLDDLWSRNA